jgi:hypothetical protein
MKQHTHFPPLDSRSLPVVSAALKAVEESDGRMNGYGAKQRGDLESEARADKITKHMNPENLIKAHQSIELAVADLRAALTDAIYSDNRFAEITVRHALEDAAILEWRLKNLTEAAKGETPQN